MERKAFTLGTAVVVPRTSPRSVLTTNGSSGWANAVVVVAGGTVVVGVDSVVGAAVSTGAIGSGTSVVSGPGPSASTATDGSFELQAAARRPTTITIAIDRVRRAG